MVWPGERRVEDLWLGFISKYHNKYQTGGLQHLLAVQVRQEVGNETFRAYFKFAIVRSPWDRVISQYAYMRERPDLRSFVGMRENDSFKRYLELISKRSHVQWLPQHRFIFDDNGEPLVDYVGRFESFADDAAHIFRRLGIDAPVPHVNASHRRATAAYYDPESLEMVSDMYAADIRSFGYSAYVPSLERSDQNS